MLNLPWLQPLAGEKKQMDKQWGSIYRRKGVYELGGAAIPRAMKVKLTGSRIIMGMVAEEEEEEEKRKEDIEGARDCSIGKSRFPGFFVDSGQAPSKKTPGCQLHRSCLGYRSRWILSFLD